ncbi:hypothetical protein D3C73_1317530 [compost metagenome]
MAKSAVERFNALPGSAAAIAKVDSVINAAAANVFTKVFIIAILYIVSFFVSFLIVARILILLHHFL